MEALSEKFLSLAEISLKQNEIISNIIACLFYQKTPEQKSKFLDDDTVKAILTIAFADTILFYAEYIGQQVHASFFEALSDRLNLDENQLRSFFGVPEAKSITQSEDVPDSEYLPGYTHAEEKPAGNRDRSNIFHNEILTCYPIEKKLAKPDTWSRFLKNYKAPEKEIKYARPILDLEYVDEELYVRCYLTLADRPRQGAKDKDITQDTNKKIVFQNVYLMNFGEPLRALTWVEEYIKNPAHAFKVRTIHGYTPIIRTFLLPLDRYKQIVQDDKMLIMVDADRAAGQVKFNECVSKLIEKHARVDSLFSFMERTDYQHYDGNILSIKALSTILLGQADGQINPIWENNSVNIAHQLGRLLAGEKRKEQDVEQKSYYFFKPVPEQIVCQHLARTFANMAQEPSSSISVSERIVKDNAKARNAIIQAEEQRHTAFVRAYNVFSLDKYQDIVKKFDALTKLQQDAVIDNVDPHKIKNIEILINTATQFNINAKKAQVELDKTNAHRQVQQQINNAVDDKQNIVGQETEDRVEYNNSKVVV